MLTAKYNQNVTLLLLLGFLALGGLGLFDGSHTEHPFPAYAMDLGYVLGVLWMVRRLLDDDAILTVSDDGVFDKRTMDRPIPWGVIRGWRHASFPRRDFHFFLVLSVPYSEFASPSKQRVAGVMLLPSLIVPRADEAYIFAWGLTAGRSEIRAALKAHINEVYD